MTLESEIVFRVRSRRSLSEVNFSEQPCGGPGKQLFFLRARAKKSIE